ncbi:MAG TPA: TetR/AcrR family transcriptional regulator [Acidimicrobiales bacterium]|nr:TetR/AcrR family transcriptional regulator [Acidimicrobiales bacterium]
MSAANLVTLDAPERAILDSTLLLLGDRGYSRLTIDEIAQRARVGKARIYRRWPSKLPLVIDAVRDVGGSELDPPDTGRLDADVYALLESFIETLQRPLGRALVRLLADAAPDPQLRHVVYDQLIRRRQELLRVILERAIARREIREDTDVDMVLELGSAAILHRLIISDEPLDLAYGTRVARLLLRGLRPD